MKRGISLLKAILGGYLLTIVMLLLLTLLVYRFQMPETGVQIGICGIYVLSCFAAGLLCGKQTVSRRFFWGLLTGVFYFVLLLLASLLAGHQLTQETPRTLFVFFLCAMSGMLGGMVS